MGNIQIKLIFPSHDLPFTVPYQRYNPQDLSGRIDRILRDLTPGGPPQQGKWVLVDPETRELLHSSCMAKVQRDRTYLVLGVGDAAEAGQLVKRLAGSEALPGYEAGAGAPRKG